MRYTGKWATAVSLLLHLGIWVFVWQWGGSVWRTSPVFALGTLLLVLSAALSWWMGRRLDIVSQTALKDSLTGLYNRRFVVRKLPQLLKAARRTGQSMTVSMIDVNDFKKFNDTYGHHAGDGILQQIAQSISSCLRKGEFAARWGGDEFIVLSPGNGRDRPAFQDLIDAKLLQLSAKKQLDISVSVGSAVYPNDTDSIEELLHTADGCMFNSKTSRKQRNSLERQPKIG